MMSNFQRKRGFMDVNRLLKPTFQQNPLAHGASAAPDSTNLQMNQAEASATQVLWGTNINAGEVQTKLKLFINTFVEPQDDEEMEGDDDAAFLQKPFYLERLKELRELEETVLEVNCDHLY